MSGSTTVFLDNSLTSSVPERLYRMITIPISGGWFKSRAIDNQWTATYRIYISVLSHSLASNICDFLLSDNSAPGRLVRGKSVALVKHRVVAHLVMLPVDP